MKKMMIFTALMTLAVSASAQAGQKYICKEISPKLNPKTLVLTQIGNTRIVEGRQAKFKLEVFVKNTAAPVISEIAVVETEDVMFAFQVKGKSIRGMIYLDELDQTSLTVNGKRFDFDCN